MSRTALFAVVTLIALASTASASGSGSWGSGSGSLAVEDSSPEPEPSNKSPQPEPEPSKPSPSPEPEPQTSKAPEPPARKTMTVNATVLTGAAKTAVKKKFADLKMTATMEKVQVASAVTLSIPIADIKAGTPARTKFEADFQKGYTNATGLPCKVSAVTATTRRMLEGATRRQLAVGVKVDFYSEVPKSMAADAASLVKTAKSEGLSIPLKVGTKDYTVALNTMEEPTVTFATTGAAETAFVSWPGIWPDWGVPDMPGLPDIGRHSSQLNAKVIQALIGWRDNMQKHLDGFVSWLKSSNWDSMTAPSSAQTEPPAQPGSPDPPPSTSHFSFGATFSSLKAPLLSLYTRAPLLSLFTTGATICCLVGVVWVVLRGGGAAVRTGAQKMQGAAGISTQKSQSYVKRVTKPTGNTVMKKRSGKGSPKKLKLTTTTLRVQRRRGGGGKGTGSSSDMTVGTEPSQGGAGEQRILSTGALFGPITTPKTLSASVLMRDQEGQLFSPEAKGPSATVTRGSPSPGRRTHRRSVSEPSPSPSDKGSALLSLLASVAEEGGPLPPPLGGEYWEPVVPPRARAEIRKREADAKRRTGAPVTTGVTVQNGSRNPKKPPFKALTSAMQRAVPAHLGGTAAKAVPDRSRVSKAKQQKNNVQPLVFDELNDKRPTAEADAEQRHTPSWDTGRRGFNDTNGRAEEKYIVVGNRRPQRREEATHATVVQRSADENISTSKKHRRRHTPTWGGNKANSWTSAAPLRSSTAKPPLSPKDPTNGGTASPSPAPATSPGGQESPSLHVAWDCVDYGSPQVSPKANENSPMGNNPFGGTVDAFRSALEARADEHLAEQTCERQAAPGSSDESVVGRTRSTSDSAVDSANDCGVPRDAIDACAQAMGNVFAKSSQARQEHKDKMDVLAKNLESQGRVKSTRAPVSEHVDAENGPRTHRRAMSAGTEQVDAEPAATESSADGDDEDVDLVTVETVIFMGKYYLVDTSSLEVYNFDDGVDETINPKPIGHWNCELCCVLFLIPPFPKDSPYRLPEKERIA